jgi:hypothetical protein
MLARQCQAGAWRKEREFHERCLGVNNGRRVCTRQAAAGEHALEEQTALPPALSAYSAHHLPITAGLLWKGS